MTFTFVSRTDIASHEWDELVGTSPDGWVFSLWDWQELILGVPKWALQDRSFGIREHGALIAVVPLQYSPHVRKLMSSGWGGSGPVLSDMLSERKRRQVLKSALDHAAALSGACDARAIEFSCSPVTRTSIAATWGVNPFELIGMRDRSRLSQIIDLTGSESELWGNLSNLAKRKIREAQKGGYSALAVDWIEFLDSYFDIHRQTYTRTGAAPHPKEYFAGIANKLSKSGHARLFVARTEDGASVAFHNSSRFGKAGYYHTGCSTNTASDSGANYLLFWEAMLDAKRAGAEWYDAGWIFPASESNKQKGLTHFKTRFGGTAHRSFFGELDIEQPETVSSSAPAPGFARRTLEKLIHAARKIS